MNPKFKSIAFQFPTSAHLYIHWTAQYFKAVVHKTLQQQGKIPLGPLNKLLAFSVPFLTPFVEKKQEKMQSAYKYIASTFFLSLILVHLHVLSEVVA